MKESKIAEKQRKQFYRNQVMKESAVAKEQRKLERENRENK